MKKVAISTLFYDNNNYGGMAQAYALQKYVSDLGYDVSLISYRRTNPIEFYNVEKHKKNFKIMFKVIRRLIKELEKILNLFYRNKLKNRVEIMTNFRENFMKHTDICDKEHFSELRQFDIFISGSDQIWRPGVLEDVDVFNNSIFNGKYKFSYASSVARDELPEKYLKYMKKNLKDYASISVRERQSSELFKKNIREDVEWVVDPTLLLCKEEWESICCSRLIKEKYLFAYILGDCPKQRKIIEKIAKEKKLCLVTIPHIKDGWLHKFKFVDLFFGDKKMYSIGISEFFSLIKYADLILTDSFHAISFSTIFRKEFFALDRSFNVDVPSMNNRIYSILNLTGLENRFIASYEDYLDECNNIINYNTVQLKENKMIEKSKKYLEDALSRAYKIQ